MTLRPSDYDRYGDIIPSGRKEEKGDLISRSTLKEDMKSRLSACNEWIEKAKDKETKIRASAVKAFIAEVIMTIDNAPTVETYTEEDMKRTIKENFDIGYEMAKNKYERPKGKWLIEGGTTLHYACSECGCAGDEWDKFCKHCGAKMSMRGDKYDT